MKDCQPKEHGYTCGPEGFTLSEIELARAAGVCIKSRYSRNINENCLASVCRKCNAHIGQKYLFMGCYVPAINGVYSYQIIYQMSMCLNCKRIA